MAHILIHQFYWVAIIASVFLTVAAGALIDRLYTGRRRYARLSVMHRQNTRRQ